MKLSRKEILAMSELKPKNEVAGEVGGSFLEPMVEEAQHIEGANILAAPGDQDVESAADYFTLKLRISGLCAVVVCEDGTVKILLVNEQARTHLHGSDEHHHVESHVAAIVTPVRHLSDRGRDKDFGFDGEKTFEGNRGMAGFLLREESIEIKGVDGVVSLDQTPRDGSCPSRRDQGSLEWCAQMRELGAGAVPVPVIYDIGVPLVKSRVILKGGALKVYSFAKDYSGRILKWVFVGGCAACSEKRALAEELEYTVRIERRLLALATKNQFPEGCLGDIILKPAGGEVLCWVLNQPMEDFMFLRERGHRKPISHFGKYFQLSSRDCAPSTPYPLSEVCPSDIGGASSPRCPIALFEN